MKDEGLEHVGFSTEMDIRPWERRLPRPFPRCSIAKPLLRAVHSHL